MVALLCGRAKINPTLAPLIPKFAHVLTGAETKDLKRLAHRVRAGAAKSDTDYF